MMLKMYLNIYLNLDISDMTDTTFTVLDNGYCRVDWLEAKAALTVLSPDSAMAWTGHIGHEVLEAVRNKFSQEPEEALTNQVFIITYNRST